MSRGRASGRLGTRAADRTLSRRRSSIVRRLREAEVLPLLALCLASALIGVAQYVIPVIPLTALLLPMVIASLVLAPRTLPWAVVLILSVLVVVAAGTPELLDGRRIGGVMVIFLIGMIILVASFRRTSLGVAGFRGESMLADLRDRINHQARMPQLPSGWLAEAALRSAGGSSFAGDFIVAALARDRRLLQVAVVDVSGKGAHAGARSLLLSGAFGGLLAALPPEQFLPAANDYLLRQDWAEGFATAVHVSLDLSSGSFELRSAGHPPGVQLAADTGRWTLHEAEGPVLGLLLDADFTVARGALRRGDALMLFTDGLVETPQRDVEWGIDRLVGIADRELTRGFERAADRLIDLVDTANDDRALLLLHRGDGPCTHDPAPMAPHS